MMRARWTIVVWVVAIALSIALAVRMRPQTSIEGLLDPSDPSVAAMSRVLANFPATEELLVLASLPDGLDDQSALLRFAERLQAAFNGSSVVADVRYRAGDEMKSFVREVVVPHGLDYLSDAERTDLLARLTPQGMANQLRRQREALAAPGPAAGEVAKQLIRDPLRLHEFLLSRQAQFAPPGQGSSDAFYSTSGRDLLIRISGTQPPSDLDFCRTITEEVTAIAMRENAEGLELRFSGAYAIAAWNATKIRSDAIWGTNGSIVGIALLFVLLYRRPIAQSLLALLPVGAGVGIGFGLYALFESELTPLSAVVGGALGGIGIDYTIHYLAHYREERASARDALDAAKQTTRSYRMPMIAALLTSVIGFAAIALSPVRLLRDFALLGSLTLLGVFAATMTLLPALLIATDRFNGGAQMRGTRLTRRAAIELAHRPKRWLVGSAVVAAIAAGVAIVGIGRIGLASDLSILHPRPNPPLEAQREISTRMGSAAGSIFVHVSASSAEELLARSHQLDRALSGDVVAQAGVTARFGLASLLPDPRRPMVDRPNVETVVADFRSALKAAGFQPERFNAYEAFLSTLLTPSAPVGVGDLLRYPETARLVLPHQALEGAPATETLALVFFDRPLDDRAARRQAIDALRDAVSSVPGATLTGLSPIAMDVDIAIRRDLPRLIALAMVLITIYLVVHFRSFLLAVMVMLPTMISLIAVCAFMVMTNASWNLVNIVMLPLLLGINVDYGIFAAASWRGARSRSALRRRFRSAVPGVFVCCCTTMIGFGSLATTSLPAVRSLGWLIIIGVSTCLAATVCLVWPAMFLARTRRNRRRG